MAIWKIGKISRNKAQQEIMGFVLIVVIMVVIGVIFLGISLRKNKGMEISTEDAEIANFLSASMKYTTDCEIAAPMYAEIKEVLSGCYDRKECYDGREACDVLNDTYYPMLSRTWPAGNNRPIEYTKLSFYYQPDAEDTIDNDAKNILLKIEQGDSGLCSVKKAGKYIQSKYPGKLIAELEVCSNA